MTWYLFLFENSFDNNPSLKVQYKDSLCVDHKKIIFLKKSWVNLVHTYFVEKMWVLMYEMHWKWSVIWLSIWTIQTLSQEFEKLKIKIEFNFKIPSEIPVKSEKRKYCWLIEIRSSECANHAPSMWTVKIIRNFPVAVDPFILQINFYNWVFILINFILFY